MLKNDQVENFPSAWNTGVEDRKEVSQTIAYLENFLNTQATVPNDDTALIRNGLWNPNDNGYVKTVTTIKGISKADRFNKKVRAGDSTAVNGTWDGTSFSPKSNNSATIDTDFTKSNQIKV